MEQKKKFIHYIKIHVPWETLSVYAEYLLLRAPLQVCKLLYNNNDDNDNNNNNNNNNRFV